MIEGRLGNPPRGSWTSSRRRSRASETPPWTRATDARCFCTNARRFSSGTCGVGSRAEVWGISETPSAELTMFADYRVPVVLRSMGCSNTTTRWRRRWTRGRNHRGGKRGGDRDSRVHGAGGGADESGVGGAAEKRTGTAPGIRGGPRGRPKVTSVALDWFLWSEGREVQRSVTAAPQDRDGVLLTSRGEPERNETSTGRASRRGEVFRARRQDTGRLRFEKCTPTTRRDDAGLLRDDAGLLRDDAGLPRDVRRGCGVVRAKLWRVAPGSSPSADRDPPAP